MERAETERTAELSEEEHAYLLELCSNLLLLEPIATDSKNPAELRAQIYTKAAEEVEQLVNEWGAKQGLEESFVAAQRSLAAGNVKPAINYLKLLAAQINQLREEQKMVDPTRSSRFDSWPKSMRDGRQFNCVGAALIGFGELEKLGFTEVRLGNPVDHVVNLAKFDGEWWYIDLNNAGQIHKIEPEELELAGQEVFRIKQPEIDYRLLAVYPKEEMVGSMLGNAATLARELGGDGEQVEIESAQKHFGQYAALLKDCPDGVIDKLSSDYSVMETEEMKEEEKRIYELWGRDDRSKVLETFLSSLSRETAEAVLLELRNRAEELEKLFFTTDNPDASRLPENLQRIFQIQYEQWSHERQHDWEGYEELVLRFFDRLKR
jgi:hypothetical protein